MRNYTLINYETRASRFFVKSQYLTKFLSNNVDEFFENVKEKSVDNIKENIDGHYFKESQGRLKKFTRSKKAGAGLESKVTIWNAVRNNTGKKRRIRYARFIEFGRKAINNPTPMKFKTQGEWVTTNRVRAARPRPFFFRGVRKAIRQSMREAENQIPKSFGVENRMMRKF